MIRSWFNRRSIRFYENGKTSKFRGFDIDAADDLLSALDAAESFERFESHRKFLGFINYPATEQGNGP